MMFLQIARKRNTFEGQTFYNDFSKCKERNIIFCTRKISLSFSRVYIFVQPSLVFMRKKNSLEKPVNAAKLFLVKIALTSHLTFTLVGRTQIEPN